MLAEIFILKLEAAVRVVKEAAPTTSTSRFVPVTMPSQEPERLADSCPRGQARLGQDGKGADNIGRWAQIMTAALGRRRADSAVRSSQRLCCDYWFE